MNDFILKTQRAICADHGGYDAKLVEQFTGPAIWTGCPRCEFDARHSADPQVRQQAVDLLDSRTTNALLMASNVQPRFRGLGFDSYRTDFAPGDQPGVLARCREYAEKFDQNWEAGRSLILLGTMGTGKTHLASAIIQAVIQADALGGANALYTTASDIIRSVKETFGKSGRSEAEVYADLCGYDLLVVDEVGAQHGTDFERQVIFEVINGRYGRKLPTIMISNLSLPEVRKFIGDRVVDRLCDNGGEVLVLRWKSVRGAA